VRLKLGSYPSPIPDYPCSNRYTSVAMGTLQDLETKVSEDADPHNSIRRSRL